MLEVTTPLKAWETFYVIVGSAAGALTGLQFVVLTLIGEAGAIRGRKETIAAFGSPNVVHFCAGLLVASILSAPWSVLLYPGVAVAACGVLGVIYSVVILRRALRQTAYQAVWEDWVWHTPLPMLAYLALLVAGVILGWYPVDALFVIGAALLLLVFIGIHNAWDTVTYVTMQRAHREREREAGAGGRAEVPRGGGREVRGGGVREVRAGGEREERAGGREVRRPGGGAPAPLLDSSGDRPRRPRRRRPRRPEAEGSG